MTAQNELHFKTNVQLKSIIGKDLINDDNIAILELVKNSFDADAKKVTVKYVNLKANDDALTPAYSSKTSRLFIQDDGLGMDFLDIRDKWLNIAYSEKKSNNRQHNRMMAGAKGVGRFSCDRLGEYLNLYAKKRNSDTYVQLKIDWKLFEVEDNAKEIQSINLNHNFLSRDELAALGIEPFEQGVLLEIIKLRSTWVQKVKDREGNFLYWNTDKFVNLKKYLEKLINPNQAFENNDFGIYMDAPEFLHENTLREGHDRFIGKVENRIFDKLDFKSTTIESEIVEEGKYILTKLKDKGNIIFWIKEKNIYAPYITNAKIIIYYLNPYSKAFFTKQTGIQSVNYGSIFLFINGFRIPPYGEVGDDWLGIDQRKNQGTARYIGLREIVGSIEILDEANNFQIISSREGIVKNENYNKLTNSKGNDSLFFRAFRRLERYVVEGISWDSIPEALAHNYREIEKKIISGETAESDLVFREDDSIKRRRVYESIHSIISARAENVVELYINEDLILDKITQERENSEREFEQLLEDFERKQIDSETLNRILLRKAEQNKDLEKQLADFSRYSVNEATSRAVLELQHYKETTQHQLRLIEDLKEQLEKKDSENRTVKLELEQYKFEKAAALELAKKEEALRLKAEVALTRKVLENDTITKELEKRKEQLSITTSIASQDLDNVTNLHHQVRVISDNIKTQITLFSRKIDKGEAVTIDSIKGFLNVISLENSKIESISKFGTRAIFEDFTEVKQADIVEFIQNYVEKITNYFSTSKLKVSFHSTLDAPFQTKFRPLDISIIIDNMISNSKKAEATALSISIVPATAGEVQLIFTDNGKGLAKDIQETKIIYEKGYSTTRSTGLGLFHIQNILAEYTWKISVTPLESRGITFTITIKQK